MRPVGSRTIWRGSARLSDGREIVYYDEYPNSGRAGVADTRAAPSGAAEVDAPGMRWDPLAGEWVLIAAARQHRPIVLPSEARAPDTMTGPAIGRASGGPGGQAGPGGLGGQAGPGGTGGQAGPGGLGGQAGPGGTGGLGPRGDLCPLCPSAPGRATEIPAESYDVAVFENRFPALRGGSWQLPGTRERGTQAQPGDIGAASSDAGGAVGAAAVAAHAPAVGRCEVVCFTDQHDASFASLTPRRVRTVVEAWADRTAVLSELPSVGQVYCFENRGERIGVTLHHPHGQVYGFPFTTPRTSRMLERATAYQRAHGGNLFDDLVAHETRARVRVIARNEHWVAFVPEAARWPYEVRFFPVPRVPDLPALSDAQRDAFGELCLSVLRGLDRIFGAPLPYIAAWHQAPAARADSTGDRALFGAHLQVFSVQRAPGKLKYLAGTESGMGVWINDVAPEDAARTIREAM